MTAVHESAVFVGCARDCAAHLPAVLQNLAALAQRYRSVAWVFVENDSTDDTKAILGEWAGAMAQVTLLTLDGLGTRVSARAERIAAARNACLEFLRTSPWRDYAHLHVFDMDAVNARQLQVDAFDAAVRFLDSDSRIAGVFPVSDPVYYDIWALRHPQWCPGDCWAEVRQHGPALGHSNALDRFVHARQIRIEPDTAPIEVLSAFGGLGLYRLAHALESRYVGTTPEGNEVCEHVTFHAGITSRGGRLFLFPRLRNQAPAEHLKAPEAPPLRRLQLSQNGRQCELIAPKAHRLDAFREAHPLYDRRLPMLARVLSEADPTGTIIDIGANIGDTVALCRLAGASASMVAIEPSQEYYRLLTANIDRLRPLFDPVRPVNAFVGRATDALGLDEHDGTARSVTRGEAASGTVPTMHLDALGLEHVSLLKVDTDGYDAVILAEHYEYLARMQPVVWAETDISSRAQQDSWRSVLERLQPTYRDVCVFDNFGFLVAHGQLSAMTEVILTLIDYARRHKTREPRRFGEPRIYYLDIALFPERLAGAYAAFLRQMDEAEAGDASPQRP